MATKTLAQLLNSLTTNLSSDLMQISRSGADYKETFANIAKEIVKEYTTNYFVTLAAKNISAGNQVTNLSVYEAGGAQEKENGFRIKVSWTGGNKTYSHLFTGTTYTIGGLAIAKWAGYGTGELTLELDKTNGDFKVISGINNSNIWDRFQTATASGVYQKVKRSINRELNIAVVDTNSRSITNANIYYGVYSFGTAAAVTFAVAFTATPSNIGAGVIPTSSSTQILLFLNAVPTSTASSTFSLITNTATTATYQVTHVYEGIEV